MAKSDIAEQVEDKDNSAAIALNSSDEKRSRILNRRLDIRILPICCWVRVIATASIPANTILRCIFLISLIEETSAMHEF